MKKLDECHEMLAALRETAPQQIFGEDFWRPGVVIERDQETGLYFAKTSNENTRTEGIYLGLKCDEGTKTSEEAVDALHATIVAAIQARLARLGGEVDALCRFVK